MTSDVYLCGVRSLNKHSTCPCVILELHVRLFVVSVASLTCQLMGIIMAPAALFAHRTPSSFSAVLRKYWVESPSDMTRARMMSPGHSDVDTSALSTSVARMSCTSVGVNRARAVCRTATAW